MKIGELLPSRNKNEITKEESVHIINVLEKTIIVKCPLERTEPAKESSRNRFSLLKAADCKEYGEVSSDGGDSMSTTVKKLICLCQIVFLKICLTMNYHERLS